MTFERLLHSVPASRRRADRFCAAHPTTAEPCSFGSANCSYVPEHLEFNAKVGDCAQSIVGCDVAMGAQPR